MNLPEPEDYIDIHDHGGDAVPGVHKVENLMAHEQHIPGNGKGIAYTFGIHPWHLSAESFTDQIEKVRTYSLHGNVIAVGEAGFDKLKGPDRQLQSMAFSEQAVIARNIAKPMFIHCVRAWDDLLEAHRRIKPVNPWLIHGFRGKKDLALQLISKGMYISFWFELIMRPESAELVRSLPVEKIFLETDGSGVEIGSIYLKVAGDLEVEVAQLKRQIYSNYLQMFEQKPSE